MLVCRSQVIQVISDLSAIVLGCLCLRTQHVA